MNNIDPATPPRSRWANVESSDVPKKPLVFPPATPKKGTELTAPVTPSTVQKPQLFQHNNRLNFKNGPFLQPPPEKNSINSINSPFNGLKSPEFTPMRRLSITNTTNLKKENLNTVSRVLFPTVTDSDIDNEDVVLLAPSIQSQSKRKLQKTKSASPGTPTDKITNFELSKEWHNKDYSVDDDSETEESNLISKEKISNPFLSNDVPTKEQRVMRKLQLLEEDPDLDKYITYVNKKGEKVKQRRVSRESQKLKPKMLFEDQIYNEDRSDLDIDLDSNSN